MKARDMWLGHSLVAPVHGLVKRGKHLLSVVKYSSTFAAQTVIPMEQVNQRASSLLLFLRSNFLLVKIRNERVTSSACKESCV